MGNAKHTPGPWHIKPGDASGFKTRSGEAGIYANARPDDDFFILQIAELTTNVPRKERAANARLIAAAPELLEALDRLASWNGKGDPSDLINQARAAIRKATEG